MPQQFINPLRIFILIVVFLRSGDTLFKTDLKDIVHVKYVTNKVSKRFRYLSYNYRFIDQDILRIF